MSRVLLSITIPSYNRHAQLCARLAEIIVQLEPGVEVWVLDNSSTPDLKKFVCDRVAGAADFVRFVRNPANIGACANVCRCFEVAEGDWVWLLGDDDPLYPGAIRSIMEATKAANQSAVLLKFNSTNGGQVDSQEVLDGLPAMSARCVNPLFYSNLLFLSSSVYRRQTMVSRLGVGYHWCYSAAPHVAMLVDAMSDGGTIILIPHELVRHGQADDNQHWNVTRVSSGFISLGDMESGGDFPAKAMPVIALHYLGGSRWWRQMVKGYLTSNGRSAAYWCGYFVRFGSTIGGPRGLLITLMAWGMRLLVKIPYVKALGSRLIHPLDTVGNLDRS